MISPLLIHVLQPAHGVGHRSNPEVALPSPAPAIPHARAMPEVPKAPSNLKLVKVPGPPPTAVPKTEKRSGPTPPSIPVNAPSFPKTPSPPKTYKRAAPALPSLPVKVPSPPKADKRTAPALPSLPVATPSLPKTDKRAAPAPPSLPVPEKAPLPLPTPGKRSNTPVVVAQMHDPVKDVHEQVPPSKRESTKPVVVAQVHDPIKDVHEQAPPSRRSTKPVVVAQVHDPIKDVHEQAPQANGSPPSPQWSLRFTTRSKTYTSRPLAMQSWTR
ncbi:hypothetical protein B0H10DRAFT_1088854 [Mycena sp. CBHHK59/15]|nr:hypothetical protein B0H10DRAFT_1088854 [Mycena sp. CBHHK59/15]